MYDYRTISTVKQAFRYRGICYAKLSGSNATYDKVAWYVRNSNIKYLYINAHGGFQLDEDNPSSLRTYVFLGDDPVVSIKRSDYPDPNTAPSWCKDLGYLEWGVRSFASMGFNYLEFAYFDCCYSGRLEINNHNELVQGQHDPEGLLYTPHSDMSFALGMGEESRSRFYQGWFDLNPCKFWPYEYENQKWGQLEWSKLGDGEDLYSAIYEVIGAQTDFGPNAPANCYRLRGQGYLTDLVLSSW